MIDMSQPLDRRSEDAVLHDLNKDTEKTVQKLNALFQVFSSMEKLNSKFLKVYANIPLHLRDSEIVAVVDNTTYTYSQLYNSIRSLEKVEQALKNMEEMKII